MKYKLNENILLQEMENEYYVIDLENEKTYQLNYDAFKIISCIEDVYRNILQIYEALGGDLENVNKVDYELIELFIREAENNNLVLIQ